MKAVVERAGIEASQVEDVVLGCAFPEAEQGMNMARIAALVRRNARERLRTDHQPLLFQRFAKHCHRRQPDYGGAG